MNTETVFGNPGTGKTYNIVQQVEALHKQGYGKDDIQILSHTKVAAKEIESRTSGAMASTIHSLAYRYGDVTKEQVASIKEIIEFSTPLIREGNEYASIFVNHTSHYTKGAGAPMLPAITKTYMFPAGTKIEGVQCYPVETGVMKIDKKILPSTGAIPLSSHERKIERKIDERFYGKEAYPGKWFFYNIGSGLYNGSHVIFLTLEIYPTNYHPLQNIVEYAKQMEIKIEYERGTMKFDDAYDLIIHQNLLMKSSLL